MADAGIDTLWKLFTGFVAAAVAWLFKTVLNLKERVVKNETKDEAIEKRVTANEEKHEKIVAKVEESNRETQKFIKEGFDKIFDGLGKLSQDVAVLKSKDRA